MGGVPRAGHDVSRTNPTDLAELLARQADQLRDALAQISMLTRRVAELERKAK